MPKFRAINQPSSSPLKPSAGARKLFDTVSRPGPEIDQARPSVVVPLLDAVAKDLEKPRKKKRSSASSKSKPRRQQAAREKKVVYSIEHSPGKSTDSPISEAGNGGADDGDYVPSKADPAEISMSSASSTPSRRSPRKHLAECPNTRSSPRDSSAPVVIKRENLPTVAAAISAKPSSPSLWSSPHRQKLYEQNEIVEIPGLVFEYEQGKKQLRIKREAMMAEKRKKKGKFPEPRSIESHESTQKTEKRKVEEQLDQDKRHKRQKSRKSQKTEVAQTSQQRSLKGTTIQEQARKYTPPLAKAEDRLDNTDADSKPDIEVRSEGSKNKKVQCSRDVGAEADCQLHESRSDQSGGQAPRNGGQQNRTLNELRRREVSKPESSQGGRKSSNSRRAQSSIAPPVFYGKRSGCQPDHSTGGSVLQPQQNDNIECSSSKALPAIGQSPNFAELKQPCSYLTPPNSLSLGKRRRAGIPSHPRECNDSPSGQENVGARQISKILPEALSVLDRPQRSFDAQRRRHQSVPVNVPSRSTTAPQRQDNALQEFSNNAALQRCVDKLEKVLERLPAAIPTQMAAPGAPAASITAPAQGLNGVERPSTGASRRKLDRNVPEHLRHTDEEIIEIGREVNRHERHKRAPEAFGSTGRLYSEYNRLLSRTIDGVTVWNDEQIRRLAKG